LIGPVDAAGLEDAVAGALEDALDAGVLGVVELEDEELLDDEHAVSAAITTTATPTAVKRVRLSLDMVLSLSFREKGHASRSIVESSADSAEAERTSRYEA
jgi:hypothetical protein